MKKIDHEAKNYRMEDLDDFADDLLDRHLDNGFESPLLPSPFSSRDRKYISKKSELKHSKDIDKQPSHKSESDNKKRKNSDEKNRHKSLKSRRLSGTANDSGMSFDDIFSAGAKPIKKERTVDSNYEKLISKFKIKKKSSGGDKPSVMKGDNPSGMKGDNPSSMKGDNPSSSKGDNSSSTRGDKSSSSKGDKSSSSKRDKPTSTKLDKSSSSRSIDSNSSKRKAERDDLTSTSSKQVCLALNHFQYSSF